RKAAAHASSQRQQQHGLEFEVDLLRAGRKSGPFLQNSAPPVGLDGMRPDHQYIGQEQSSGVRTPPEVALARILGVGEVVEFCRLQGSSKLYFFTSSRATTPSLM